MAHVRVQGDEASGRWHVMVAMVELPAGWKIF
jgi:hypothetical protein